MTIDEASKRYNIPLNILHEYERWGLCNAVKKVMGAWQYDDTDLERLSLIMTLHDIGFESSEIEIYMKLMMYYLMILRVSRFMITLKKILL